MTHRFASDQVEGRALAPEAAAAADAVQIGLERRRAVILLCWDIIVDDQCHLMHRNRSGNPETTCFLQSRRLTSKAYTIDHQRQLSDHRVAAGKNVFTHSLAC